MTHSLGSYFYTNVEGKRYQLPHSFLGPVSHATACTIRHTTTTTTAMIWSKAAKTSAINTNVMIMMLLFVIISFSITSTTDARRIQLADKPDLYPFLSNDGGALIRWSSGEMLEVSFAG